VPQAIDIVLQRYLAGTCTAEEEARVAHWAAADPDHRAQLDRLRAIGAAWRDLRPSADSRDSWRHAAERLGLSRSLPAARRMPGTGRRLELFSEVGPRRLGASGAWKWAAAAMLLLAVGFSVTLRHGRSTQTALRTRDYVTRAGERETVTLSDGTRFTLAPASQLSVPLDYASGNRRVTLTGEAFFSVMHDVQHPFTIRTSHMVATDIGTQFDVRAYERDTVVRVAVRDGAVSLTAGGAPVLVRANDLAVLSPSGGIMVSRDLDVAAYTGWTTGTLLFRDVPLRDVVRELSRWYDVDIALASPALAVRRITLTVGDTATDHTLQAVAALAYARVERRGRHVLITSDLGDR
jgi:ferric-dicitrate binding protein FerR (iron transport regulator)